MYHSKSPNLTSLLGKYNVRTDPNVFVALATRPPAEILEKCNNAILMFTTSEIAVLVSQQLSRLTFDLDGQKKQQAPA